jgi:hypothetical protein
VVEGTLTHELTLTDLRARPLLITSVETTSSWLTAAAGPLVRDAFGNATSKIRLAITAECPAGRHSESIVIHTSDATYPALTVPVTVVKRQAPACTVTPSEVRLTTGPPRVVRVADRSERALQLQNVQAGDPAVACTWAAGPDHQATVKLQIDPARWNGAAVQTEVRIEIARPDTSHHDPGADDPESTVQLIHRAAGLGGAGHWRHFFEHVPFLASTS